MQSSSSYLGGVFSVPSYSKEWNAELPEISQFLPDTSTQGRESAAFSAVQGDGFDDVPGREIELNRRGNHDQKPTTHSKKTGNQICPSEKEDAKEEVASEEKADQQEEMSQHGDPWIMKKHWRY